MLLFLLNFSLLFPGFSASADTKTLCDTVGLTSDGSMVEIYKLDLHHPVIRRASLKTLGTELLSGGIDVQTHEPKDSVYLRPAHGSTSRFELVYEDHAFTRDGVGVSDLFVVPCSREANELLSGAIRAAR
jgi:hypothetical protein